MDGNGVGREAVLTQLQLVLASTPFRHAERSAGLLRYLVERSLDAAGDRMKEYTVGVEALGRGKDFDPRTDPIVRAEASRLRGRLERYYAGEGQSNVVLIELPKGTYVPRFQARTIPGEVPTAEMLPPRQAREYVRPFFWGAIGTVALLGAFGAGVLSQRSSSTAEQPTARFEVQLQSDERIGSDVGTNVVISPDGSRAVFLSVDSLGVTHLRVRSFDGSPPINLPGTAGGRGPFWSPDSRWIGFWAAGQLRKVAVDGGSPVVLCNATDLLGASWIGNETIIAALDATSQLFRVNAASGGTPVPVVDLAAENALPKWPEVLPGGKEVLYTVLPKVGVDQARIEVVTLANGKRKTLVEGGTFGRYVAPGYLTFVNQGTLYAMRFDPKRLETREPRVPVLDDVAYSPTFGFADISIAKTGVAVYRRSAPNGLIVARVDSAGRQTPLLESPGQYEWPALSPDGRSLALSVVENGERRVTLFTNLEQRPRQAWNVSGYDKATWTRDGRQLVARDSNGIVSLSASSGEPRTLIKGREISVPWTFGPGDRYLAFAVLDPATAFDLWIAPIEDSGNMLRAGSPVPFLRSRFFEVYPAISPDGRWLAYASNESGTQGVYVRSLADSSVKVLIANGAGVPRWSRAGPRLFFQAADQRIMVASYSTAGEKFVPGKPHQWTPIRIAGGVLSSYDLGPDDHYIVALLPDASRAAQAENHVTVIRGFLDEVRRKAR